MQPGTIPTPCGPQPTMVRRPPSAPAASAPAPAANDEPAAPPDTGEPSVKTIDRAARLLRALTTHDWDGVALSELARQAGLGKATTHRLLSALIDVGFAYQDGASRRYRLGSGLGALARAAHQQDAAALAMPSLMRIAQASQDTAYASVREGVAAVCVGRAIGAFPIRTLSLNVGDRRPLGVGSGSLALLAFLPDTEIATIVERNRRWLADFPGFGPAELERLVRDTRRYGFSFIDGLVIPSMNAIGVPVRDASGAPIAALSIAAIADRIKGERIAELVGLLQREAATLAAVLQPPRRASTPAETGAADTPHHRGR
jgi:DNA-binding IclR family transcriptional regulator